MRIAMIGQKGLPATYGGVERHVEELAAALAERGHAVTVYSRPHYSAFAGDHRGATARRLASIPTKHLDAISHTLLATLDALGRGYDVVHYHSVGPAALCALPHLAGARTVVTVHGLDWRRGKWGPVARWLLRAAASATRAADAVIAVSGALQEEMRRAFGVHATLIPNGVAVRAPVPLDRLAKRLGLRKGGYVLFLGRFVPEKGCDLLIRAFRAMPHDLRLVLAGDSAGGECLGRLRELAAGDERILFPGGLYGEEKEEALSNAAAFVLPSYVEGMAISLLEALSYGCPALVSDIPQNREVIELEGDAPALLFPSGDAEGLRRQLARLLAAGEAGKARARRAAARIAARHDWRVIAGMTESVYRGE